MVTLESCSILFSRILRCYVEMLNTTQLCNSAVFRFPGFGLSKTLHALGTIIGKIPTKTTGPPTARHPSLGGSFKVSNLNSTSPTLVKPSAGHYNAISARAIVALYDFPGLIVRSPTRIQRPGIWMDLGHFYAFLTSVDLQQTSTCTVWALDGGQNSCSMGDMGCFLALLALLQNTSFWFSTVMFAPTEMTFHILHLVL